jgi:hypothetical protein
MPQRERNRQNDFEKLRNTERLIGFNERNSIAWSFLSQRFGPKLTRLELVSLAQVVSEHLRIPLDREAFRRRRVLLKWFEENWAYVEPFLRTNVVVLDTAGDAIGGDPRHRSEL